MEWRSAREGEVKRIKVDKQVQPDVRATTNVDELLSRTATLVLRMESYVLLS